MEARLLPSRPRLPLEEEVQVGEGMTSREPEFKLHGTHITIRVGLNDRIAANLDDTELTRGIKGIPTDESEGIIDRTTVDGVDCRQVDNVPTSAAGPLEVGNDVAGTHQRVIERIKVERIVTRATGHGVHAGAACDDVVAAVTDNHVSRSIAGRTDVAGTRQRQVLEVIGKGEADRALYGVGTGVVTLSERITPICFEGVVSSSTDKGVSPASTIKDVVANAAVQRVVEGVTGQVIVAGATGHTIDTGDRGEAGGLGEREVDHCGSAQPGIDQRIVAVAEVCEDTLDPGYGPALECGEGGTYQGHVQYVGRVGAGNGQGVAAGRARVGDGVVTVTEGIVYRIASVTAVDHVVIGSASEHIEARTAKQGVTASASADGVIAVATIEALGTTVESDGVIPLCANDILDVGQQIVANLRAARDVRTDSSSSRCCRQIIGVATTVAIVDVVAVITGTLAGEKPIVAAAADQDV